ncbi:branched-chain amino acid transaminase [Kitasatospora sp. NBC_01266]|uniref:branched-chain amino acid transaminase n=1 Tax=Kitasatospora sp. NBC_01266 TaxID=2903572 RepID=UPI002E3423AF|nr:branched-chain amino acid transaminase [Kitasatospora sp. NBC_01266]
MTTQAEPAVAATAYHQGAFVPFTEAALPLTTQALQYGTGVFEGIRAHASADGGRLLLFRAHDHYERFLRSCRLLRIETPHTVDELVEITCELLQRNGTTTDTYLRPLGYKLALLPGTRPGVGLSGISDALSITGFPMGAYTPPGGIRCTVSSWVRPRSAAIPIHAKVTGGYVNNALAADEARAAGYDDAILLDGRGRVCEASTANVFAVRAGRLLTPPATADLLPGITRDTVLTLAADHGIEADEDELDVSDLHGADEVFLTGTGIGITPVNEVSGHPIGAGEPGPITRSIARHYARTIRGGGDPQHQHWLTPVRIGRG